MGKDDQEDGEFVETDYLTEDGGAVTKYEWWTRKQLDSFALKIAMEEEYVRRLKAAEASSKGRRK